MLRVKVNVRVRLMVGVQEWDQCQGFMINGQCQGFMFNDYGQGYVYCQGQVQFHNISEENVYFITKINEFA